jgi:hypothetical protein
VTTNRNNVFDSDKAAINNIHLGKKTFTDKGDNDTTEKEKLTTFIKNYVPTYDLDEDEPDDSLDAFSTGVRDSNGDEALNIITKRKLLLPPNPNRRMEEDEEEEEEGEEKRNNNEVTARNEESGIDGEGDSEEDEEDEEGSNNPRGGGARGNRGRGTRGNAPPNARRKERNKGRVGNHNRKDQAAKKACASVQSIIRYIHSEVVMRNGDKPYN